MEQVIMKKVLEEILDEQKIANEDKRKVEEALEQLVGQVKNFESKLQSIRISPPSVNTLVIEHLVSTHLQTVDLHLDLHFKKVAQLQKKKDLKEEILYWLPWFIVIILCAILLKIVFGGQFGRSIF